MKLIGSLASPYVRKVRIVLAEKKIECALVLETSDDGNGVTQWNPLGRAPVLLLDDGTALFDSRVIVEYLDNLAPNNRLIPPPGRERIMVRRFEALADGICDAAVSAVLENDRKGAQKCREWIEHQQAAIARGLAACADELGEQSWCFGTAISLADIALGSMLGYLDWHLPEIDWRGQHANLAKHYEKLMQRPSFADSIPPAA